MKLEPERHLSFWQLLAWLTSVALLGVCYAIPLKRQMINVENLKFPSGIAAAADAAVCMVLFSSTVKCFPPPVADHARKSAHAEMEAVMDAPYVQPILKPLARFAAESTDPMRQPNRTARSVNWSSLGR